MPRRAGSCPVISNVRHRRSRMRSLASHREVSTRRRCCFARGTKAVLPRAVRPLAASAPLLVREALAGPASSHAMPPVGKLGCLSSLQFWPAKGREFKPFSSVRRSCSSASRWSARPGCSGSAATSFARGGGFGLLAGVTTQRTMRAGSVLLGALPNHSINRTCPGKPGHAGYLKR